MDARTRTAAGVLTVAVAFVVGCESGPVALDRDLMPAAIVVPTPTVAQVTVCKDGPQDYLYSFGITALTDKVVLPFGNTVEFGMDIPCRTVATTDDMNQKVTLVENTPPAGTVFSKVEVYNYGTISKYTQPLQATYTSNDPIQVGPFGGDNGWVVVYYNIPAPSTGCTLTQGFWKNHAADWPVSSLMLGGVSYTKAQLLSILRQPVQGNGLISMSHQLIAAKLNILAGASGSAVAAAIASADAMIGGLVVPPVGDGSLATRNTGSLNTMLDNFNRGLTGPGHCGGD